MLLYPGVLLCRNNFVDFKIFQLKMLSCKHTSTLSPTKMATGTVKNFDEIISAYCKTRNVGGYYIWRF